MEHFYETYRNPLLNLIFSFTVKKSPLNQAVIILCPRSMLIQ